MTPTSKKQLRWIAGAALLGVGGFFLRENLDLVLARLNQAGEGPGFATTLTMAATRDWQAYALNHLQFVHESVLPLLASCWPVLLIVGGAFLSRDTFSGDCEEPGSADCGNAGLPRQFSDIQ